MSRYVYLKSIVEKPKIVIAPKGSLRDEATLSEVEGLPTQSV